MERWKDCRVSSVVRRLIRSENKRLREQIARLTERLDTAEELIEVQGNAFALLQAMSRKSDNVK